MFVVCAALRCIMERPAEKLFYRANARCKLEHPTEQISAQRAIVYSATEARFSTPIFRTSVEDALI
jgi:hypothetical protein